MKWGTRQGTDITSKRYRRYPLLKHKDAWGSYVNARINAEIDPPVVFPADFLVKLGFDRMVMDMPGVKK